MQSMEPHPTLTLVLSIWAGVGPLAGLLVGHYLIRTWQREQWILDSRKQEFRELVSSLSNAAIEHIAYLATLGSSNRSSAFSMFLEAHKKASRTIADPIFIAQDVEKMKLGVCRS